MKYNEVFSGAIVKDGYRMLALVADGGYWQAVIYREKPQDFVYCSNYDITDGTWGAGYYCGTYAAAVSEMCKRLG